MPWLCVMAVNCIHNTKKEADRCTSSWVTEWDPASDWITTQNISFVLWYTVINLICAHKLTFWVMALPWCCSEKRWNLWDIRLSQKMDHCGMGPACSILCFCILFYLAKRQVVPLLLLNLFLVPYIFHHFRLYPSETKQNKPLFP